MELNEIGEIANRLWLEIPKQFSFIHLGEFLIMPNHIHGLLNVETQFIASKITEDLNQPAEMNCEPAAMNCFSTVGGFAGNENPLLNKNISQVIRWYKGRCIFEIRNIYADFSWQTRFYDHIIRDQQSLKNIENYIKVNLLKWKDDKFY